MSTRIPSPPRSSVTGTAQSLDSIRANRLALEMGDDIHALEQLADIQFIQYGLPTIEAHFEIEFDLPETEDPEPARTRAHLELVYREGGAEALLEEAARMEEVQGWWPWRAIALENIARTEGPQAALEAARERGLLDSASHQLLNGAGLRRLDEVLSWVEAVEIYPEHVPDGVTTHSPAYWTNTWTTSGRWRPGPHGDPASPE